jgi:hypothetical protein
MPVDSTTATRPSFRLRADLPERAVGWPVKSTRPAVLALAIVFVVLGASSLDLGPVEARLGMASGEALGPFGRVFGYWDPSLWPLSVVFGRVWAFFEEVGPTQNVVRWPSAIAGVLIGLLLARRARLALGPRAGVLVALAWYGSFALIDRSAVTGLDLIAGLGTVAALDRLLARGSGWVVGAWASLAFLAAGWPPLAVLGLATVVLGRSAATWSWSTTIPVVATVAGWSAWALATAPAEAWATALALPITQPSSWGLAFTAIGLGLPWVPFALLATNQSLREGWSKEGRAMALGWLKVVGACLIVGMMVPGLGSAALVPALAGLAVLSASCWDRVLTSKDEMPEAVGRRATRISLAISGLWLFAVVSWGGYVGFAVAYYRATIIVVALLSLAGFLMAIRSCRLGEAKWALGSIVAVSIALKLAHWGYYAPESNYRIGAGPWGRAIGQWVPEKHPIYVLHSWPADLAFATARPFRQLATPQHIEFQPGKGSKFVLLQDSEYAEYQGWSKGWPKLIKVAEFEDEMGLSKRILTRTDAPLIVERPYRKHDPVE